MRLLSFIESQASEQLFLRFILMRMGGKVTFLISFQLRDITSRKKSFNNSLPRDQVKHSGCICCIESIEEDEAYPDYYFKSIRKERSSIGDILLQGNEI